MFLVKTLKLLQLSRFLINIYVSEDILIFKRCIGLVCQALTMIYDTITLVLPEILS